MPLWRHLAGGAQPTLPMPMVQIFGGGAHAGRRVDIQDFLVVPIGASTFDEAIVDRGEDLRVRGTHHGRARRASRCGGRGRLVARVHIQQRRARCAPSRDRTGRSQAGHRRGDCYRRCGVATASRAHGYRFAAGESRADAATSSPTSSCSGAAAIPSSLSRIRWPRMMTPACARSPRAPGATCRSSGMITS